MAVNVVVAVVVAVNVVAAAVAIVAVVAAANPPSWTTVSNGTSWTLPGGTRSGSTPIMRCERYRGGSTRCSSLSVASGGQHGEY